MIPLDASAVHSVAFVAAVAMPLAAVVRHAIAHRAASRRMDRCLDAYERLRAPGSDAGADISRIVRSLRGEPGDGTPLPGA